MTTTEFEFPKHMSFQIEDVVLLEKMLITDKGTA